MERLNHNGEIKRTRTVYLRDEYDETMDFK